MSHLPRKNRIQRSATLCLTWAVLATVFEASPAFAAPIVTVSPGSAASVEGNSNNGYVFNTQNGFSPARDQEVYSSSLFSAQSEPMYIKQIAFRQDVAGGASSVAIPDLRIALSTTSRGPNQLSTTFADNTGQDTSTVFSGPLSISTMQVPDNIGSAPRPFDILINLQKPFLYDPSKGNLLVDMTNMHATKFSSIDAVEATNLPISRVYSWPAAWGPSGGDLAHGISERLGMVTRFQTDSDPTPWPQTLVIVPPEPLPVPIPEPSTFLVLILGLAGLRHSRAFRKGT